MVSASSSTMTQQRKQQHHHRRCCSMKRIKLLLGFFLLMLVRSTWNLVHLAHHTLPSNPQYHQQQQQQQQQPIISRRTITTSTNGGVPFLPALPRYNRIPPHKQIQQWMKTSGMETAGQFLLDFAIVGNAKCGTSTIMNWLGLHPQIQIPQDELYHLKYEEPWDLLGVFYHYFGDVSMLRPDSIKGYKSPNDVGEERPMRLIRTYFPQTKLIVGIRHPIPMMESFYNFRIQNGYDMPPLEDIHYHNAVGQYGVSWSRAEYHTALVNLGKTTLSSDDELALMPPYYKKKILKRRQEIMKNITDNDNNSSSQQQVIQPFPRMPNPVFLYEMGQLADNDSDARLKQFGQDMANYLGLTLEDLPPIPHHKPGKKLQNVTLQAERDAKKIRICDDRYEPQRKRLLDIGNRTAEWILNYFLSPSSNSDSVFVSNPKHFRELLLGYSKDPCKK